MDRLTELATFLAVLDHGGFAPAARALRKSPPTVTRVISDLEQRIGVRLFDRTSRRCIATEQGSRFAQDARAVLASYDEAISIAAGEAGSPQGHIRMTAPYFFGRQHIAPSILRFLELNPGISVELDLADRVKDLHADGLDLAVRIGPIADVTLLATRVGWLKRVIVGSPAYLAKHGIPKLPAELSAHSKIQHGYHVNAPWQLTSGRGRIVQVPVQARFTVNQADAALAAARAGHGLVTALSYQVHDDFKGGTLVRILEEFELEPLPVWLTWPEGRDRLLRVRMAIQFLTEKLRHLDVIAAQ
ncbi:MAG TPA: LysR family transcriptional regulator [Sphingomicrobium sp.]|nr:LysR family transcriptional regulator [Sphingomicrobium sp.]